jgi:hypothetical protein
LDALKYIGGKEHFKVWAVVYEENMLKNMLLYENKLKIQNQNQI